MTCAHCKASVENGLRDLSGVGEVVADPDHDMVTVEAGSVDDEKIRLTIEKLGYIFRGRK
jgi:copper chaperone CopZ